MSEYTVMSDIVRQKQIIEKTVSKICEGIKAGIWRFSLRSSDNFGSSDVDEIDAVEGKAVYQEYEVSLSFQSERSLASIDLELYYRWCFSSNLKSNREEPFVLQGGFSGARYAVYDRHDPERQEILELVIDSIDILQEAQIDFDLQDIDNTGCEHSP